MKRFIPALAVAAALAVPTLAQARTPHLNLHYFGRDTAHGGQFTTPSGLPVAPNKIQPGDELFDSDALYLGNHRHHTRFPTAQAALNCFILSIQTDTGAINTHCVGVIAFSNFNGAFIEASHDEVFTQNSGPVDFPINHGTGVFAHARGNVHATSIPHSNNVDFTITIR
jgi:hypothetical protein